MAGGSWFLVVHDALAPADAERVLKDLSHDLMSPYCPGRTLASCPSDAARELEDQIYAQAKAGKTRDEIEAALVQRFGAQIVGYQGAPVLLWGSGLAALVALGLIVLLGRRWARGRARGAAGGEPAGQGRAGGGRASQAELDRIEDELDELESF